MSWTIEETEDSVKDQDIIALKTAIDHVVEKKILLFCSTSDDGPAKKLQPIQDSSERKNPQY